MVLDQVVSLVLLWVYQMPLNCASLQEEMPNISVIQFTTSVHASYLTSFISSLIGCYTTPMLLDLFWVRRTVTYHCDGDYLEST